MSTFNEIADWLQHEADERTKTAHSRRQGLNRNASVAQLKHDKAMAEHMFGRKLDLVSATRKSNIAYCDLQERIAMKLETEARKLSSWAEFLNSGADGGNRQEPQP